MCWIKKLYSGFEVVFGTWTSNGLQLQLDQILSLESLTEVKKSRGRRHAPLFRLYVIIDNFCVFWLLTNSFASFPLILFMFVEFLHFSSHFSVLSMYFCHAFRFLFENVWRIRTPSYMWRHLVTTKSCFLLYGDQQLQLCLRCTTIVTIKQTFRKQCKVSGNSHIFNHYNHQRNHTSLRIEKLKSSSWNLNISSYHDL